MTPDTTPPAQPAQTNAAAAAAATGYSSAALPSSLWLSASQIPMESSYHWQSPAAEDKQGKASTAANWGQFWVTQACGATLSSGDTSSLAVLPVAQSYITPTTGGASGNNDWLAQETIVGGGSAASQSQFALFQDLVSEAKSCASTTSGASVQVGTDQGSEFAATLKIPTSTGATLTVHEYLAAPFGYLVEFAMWVSPYAGNPGPTVPWDGTSDASVLSAIQAGPCAASKAC